MSIETYLQDNRRELVGKWVEILMSVYSKDSALFFKDTKDAFSNPVGNTFKQGLEELYGELIRGNADFAIIGSVLEPVIRIRAAQELPPADALSYIFKLQSLVENALVKYKGEEDVSQYLAHLRLRVDQVMLAAFSLYVKCREKIYTLKANQARNGVRQLLIKKGLVCEIPDAGIQIQNDK